MNSTSALAIIVASCALLGASTAEGGNQAPPPRTNSDSADIPAPACANAEEMKLFCSLLASDDGTQLPSDCVNFQMSGTLPVCECGTPPPAGGSDPRQADQFVDSIGVVLKFGDGASYSPQMHNRLKELGVRRIRGVLRAAAAHASEVQALADDLGVKLMLFVNDYGDAQSMSEAEAVQALIKIGVKRLSGVGAENEPEYFGGNAQQARAQLARLYRAVKGNPATKDVLVFTPSISATGVVAGMAKKIGDVSAISDGVDIHSYPHPIRDQNGLSGKGYSHPEMIGGTLLASLVGAKQMGGDDVKHLIGSETGYPTQPENPWIQNPELADAIYTVRLYFTLYNNKMEGIYKYVARDGHTGGADKEDNFGFMHTDLSPKPSYTYVSNLTKYLSIFSDAGG